MQTETSYELILSDIYRIENGALHGSHAEIAILDDGVEIDRIRREGMIRGSSYRVPYHGKPGLTADLASGVCTIRFEATA